ncbi:MAG TPA: hypothetical protein VGF53_09915 [Pseudolabrys sp.]
MTGRRCVGAFVGSKQKALSRWFGGIVENVIGFFAILTEWSRAEMPVPANDATKPSTSDTGEVPYES